MTRLTAMMMTQNKSPMSRLVMPMQKDLSGQRHRLVKSQTMLHVLHLPILCSAALSAVSALNKNEF